MSSVAMTNSTSVVHNVFVYGSLMAEDVCRVLLNRVPQSSSATLNDYHRYSIKGRVYPAILPVENKKVTGKVLLGITDPELHILDEFEDVEYQRSTVEVSLMESSENLQVHTYVWCDKNDPNLYGGWDFELFELIENGKVWKQTHMEDFIKMTCGFMEELEQPESKPRVATYESYYQHDP